MTKQGGDERRIIEIQVEELSKNNYGYKIIGWTTYFMTLKELSDFFRKNIEK